MGDVETKRGRVRRLLINPLVNAGLRKQVKMKAQDYSDMLVRLADKLSYLGDDSLRGLVPLITRHAKGKGRNQWPDEVSILSWAYAMQSPPSRDCPYVVSLLRSEAGRRAQAMGYLVELFMHARKYGPPYSKVNLSQLEASAGHNRQEAARVTAMIERGTAPLERRQWLDWYLRHESEALAIIDAKQERESA